MAHKMIDNDIHEHLSEQEMERELTWYEVHMTWALTKAVIVLISTLVCIAADLLLVWVICKHDKLRRSQSMIYLQHLAISNAVYKVVELVIALHVLINGHVWIDFSVMSILWELEIIGMINIYLLTGVLLLDCLGLNYGKPKLKPFWVLLTIYLIDFVQFVISFFCSRYDDYGLQTTLVYVLLLGLYLVYAVLRRRLDDDDEKGRHLFVISGIVIYTWLPLLIHYALMRSIEWDGTWESILHYSFCLVELATFLSSLLIVYYLSKVNRSFWFAYRAVFKRDGQVNGDSLQDFDDVQLAM